MMKSTDDGLTKNSKILFLERLPYIRFRNYSVKWNMLQKGRNLWYGEEALYIGDVFFRVHNIKLLTNGT
jgi:hypothetical protein